MRVQVVPTHIKYMLRTFEIMKMKTCLNKVLLPSISNVSIRGELLYTNVNKFLASHFYSLHGPCFDIHSVTKVLLLQLICRIIIIQTEILLFLVSALKYFTQ